MNAERCILRVQYTPVGRQVRRQVAGFVKYIEHRDRHRDDPRLAGLLKYVAHRDQAAARGDMFGPEGPAGKYDRRHLVGFVARAFENSTPQLYRNRVGALVDGRRAVHRLVISPEFADGLDLKRLTRAAMAQLAQDCHGLGPWIAAEHRNTAHPHVHVVIAGRREVAPGRYRSIVISRDRLRRMKLAIGQDIELQRQLTPHRRRPLMGWANARTPNRRLRLSRRSLAPACMPAVHGLRRLARQYAREAEREALSRALDRERGR